MSWNFVESGDTLENRGIGRMSRGCLAGRVLCAALAITTCCILADPAKARGPCLLKCPDDKILNAEACRCERTDNSSPRTLPCMLVCGPDQTLDARRCRCVTR
jgi:hypothetical protein